MHLIGKAAVILGLVALSSYSFAEIRVVPVKRSPESNNTELTLVYPHPNEVKSDPNFNYEFRVEGFPLGTMTEYETRSREIHSNSQGQSIRILVDNKFCVDVSEALIDALDDNADYFEQRITGKLKCGLAEGEHLLQAFPIRSYNESLKTPKSYVASIFYIKQKGDTQKFNLSQPYITYNQPQGSFAYHPTRPILLDFIIKNCQLSADGYKIRFSIDGKVERVLTDWIPYYIYDLPKGNHTIRLELLDPNNAPVPSFFCDITQTITLT